MKNKTIVIAGANGLIGSEIVKYLRQNNYDNILCVDPKLKDNIDLSCSLTVHKLFDMYDIGAFVNCAYPTNFEEHCELFTNANCLFAHHLACRNYGSIVNFSSIYGVVGSDPSIYKNTEVKITPEWYVNVKSSIIAHSRYLACKYASKNVRINCISPGGVYNNHSKKFVENYSKKVPMGRMANPIDMCGIVELLISDRSLYITGQNICVDGGYTIW